MAWKYLLATAIGVCLFQLGALSVWVTVLSLAVQALSVLAIVIVLGVGSLFVWRRYKDSQGQ